MATKKDLIEAQGFSRRRLLSAFTSGAPGGKELEPAKPLRAVAAGIALTAIIVIGGVFYGLIRPGLPSGWENNSLILVKDTGARYVTIDGVLYPVINTASARLLMPSGKYSVVSTDSASLNGIKIGAPIGILGAPDTLPVPANLIGDGWSACAIDNALTSVAISTKPAIMATTAGTVVSLDDKLFVVVGDLRYEVDSAQASAVLRAVGLDTAPTKAVDGRWLNLFDPGQKLEPIVIAGAGAAIRGTDLEVGAVVHPQGSGADERYIMTADGKLAKLSPLAYQLYLLGSGAVLGGEHDVTPSKIAALPTAQNVAGGFDWPKGAVAPISSGLAPCALLTHDKNGDPHTGLAVPPADATFTASDAGVVVSVDHGALVRAGGEGAQSSGIVFLIDESGTAYPVPGAGADIVGKLGYPVAKVTRVPQAWIQFMPTGPSLTVGAAGSSPQAALPGN